MSSPWVEMCMSRYRLSYRMTSVVPNYSPFCCFLRSLSPYRVFPQASLCFLVHALELLSQHPCIGLIYSHRLSLVPVLHFSDPRHLSFQHHLDLDHTYATSLRTTV